MCLQRLLATFLPYLTELAREVLSEADLSDLHEMFADDIQVSHNPMRSLTRKSSVIVPDISVVTWAGYIVNISLKYRKGKRKEAIPEGQIGLGI